MIELKSGKTLEIVYGDETGELYDGNSDERMSVPEALAPVTEFAEEAVATLKEITGASEFEVTMGAEAGASGGLFGLAKAHAKATITLKLKWVL